jgi:small-conductance mechanosensitive channel
MNDIFEWIQTNTRTIGEVIAIVVLGTIVYLLARRGLGMLGKRGVETAVIGIFRLFLRWIFVLLVLLLVLQQLGILQDVWAALVAVMAMVAIGFFAVWSILSNSLSTLLILIYKPFRIGDAIDIPADGLGGVVVDLNLMFTTLRDDEGRMIQIPNNQFFQKVFRRKPGSGGTELIEQLRKPSA